MSEQPIIRILVVDDHEMLRQGLAVFLRSFDDLTLAGEASNGYEALLACEQTHPDVVLMDLMMPEMDGITAARAILQKYPDIRIIALTSADDHEHITAALQAGVTGYVLKNISTDELAKAIRSAYKGKRTLFPEVTESLVSMVTYTPGTRINLSEREIEVLGLMVKGMNNIEIANQMVISRSTVKSHVSNILTKMGVKTRLEAVKMAMEQHLIS